MERCSQDRFTRNGLRHTRRRMNQCGDHSPRTKALDGTRDVCTIQERLGVNCQGRVIKEKLRKEKKRKSKLNPRTYSGLSMMSLSHSDFYQISSNLHNYSAFTFDPASSQPNSFPSSTPDWHSTRYIEFHSGAPGSGWESISHNKKGSVTIPSEVMGLLIGRRSLMTGAECRTSRVP